MKAAIIIGLLTLAVSGAFAQNAAVRLSAEACRAKALSDNVASQTSANDIASATQTRREAFTKYFPEISAGGMSFRANTDILKYDVLDLFSLGIIKKGTMLEVSAVQPIFAGGQIVNGNALAKVGERVAELKKRLSDEELLLTVDKYYWQIVSLESQRATLKSLLAMLDTLEYQSTVAVDAGVMLRNDLLKVRLQKNDFEASLIDLDNGIAVCSNLLGQFVGMGLTPVLPQDSIVPGAPVAFPQQLWRDPAEALTGVPEYGLLSAGVRAAELEKRIAVGKNLPTVGLGGGWFHHNLIEQNQGFWMAFVTVQVPLSGWWGGAHAIKRSSLALANARLKLQSDGELLQIGMMDAWNNVTAAYRKLSTSQESIEQSAENLRLNEQYYAAGTATISDLLDAQLLYKRAADQYVAAYAQLCVSESAYRKAVGL
jgi:outer membrane protein TolC